MKHTQKDVKIDVDGGTVKSGTSSRPTATRTPAFIDGVTMPEGVCFGVRRGVSP